MTVSIFTLWGIGGVNNQPELSGLVSDTDNKMKRSRGRGRRQQNPVNRSYDSSGPDVRVRGTASQVYEKYQALARDAMASGDRVMAENYSQHGEHYYRIMLSFQPAPGEAEKDANGEAKEADTANSDAAEDGASGAEPLVLVRDAANGEESAMADDKPAKSSSNTSPNASRRRGPLRKKKAEAADTAHDAGKETANGEADVEPQLSVVDEASSDADTQSAE